jgi:tetratricopeptide (TPR) repeat protein
MDYIEYAMANYHAKQYARSLEIVQAGLQKDPMNATLNRIALMNANEVKNYGVALKYADNMFNKIDKDSVKLNDIDYLNYGKALAGNEQFDAAIEKFKAALNMSTEDKSQHASIYKAMSDAYKGMKDFPNAIESYQQFLKADESADATEYASLGTLMMQYARSLEGDAQMEAYRQADQHFADLVAKFPDSEEYALFQRGRINNSLDPDMAQGLAKPHFEKLAELITARGDADDTDKQRLEGAYRYLMAYYNAQKDYPNALVNAKKLLDLKPEDEGIQKLVEMLTKAASK